MIQKDQDYNLSQYNLQLAEKEKQVEKMFSTYCSVNNLKLEVYQSSYKNYRMRAEFRVWHEGEDFFFVMFDKETKEIVKLSSFPAASLLINLAMFEVKSLVKTEVLKRKLFQIDFLSTSTNELLISLIYHKKLDELWESEARCLMDNMQDILSRNIGRAVNLKIIGRARKQKVVLKDDFVTESFFRNEQVLSYKQVENSFTQPNYEVAQKMLSWADSKTTSSKGDLLEMYCGNGNFSLYLAANFNKVLATEISSSSVEAAQYNISINKLSNVTILRLSAEEFTQAIEGNKEFRRLKGIDLKSYQCQTILVDPPRSGLDDRSVQMVSLFDRIIYISCNPETLAKNLEQLTKTHAVTSIALFDQFPFTHHVEVGVILDVIKVPYQEP